MDSALGVAIARPHFLVLPVPTEPPLSPKAPALARRERGRPGAVLPSTRLFTRKVAENSRDGATVKPGPGTRTVLLLGAFVMTGEAVGRVDRFTLHRLRTPSRQRVQPIRRPPSYHGTRVRSPLPCHPSIQMLLRNAGRDSLHQTLSPGQLARPSTSGSCCNHLTFIQRRRASERSERRLFRGPRRGSPAGLLLPNDPDSCSVTIIRRTK